VISNQGHGYDRCPLSLIFLENFDLYSPLMTPWKRFLLLNGSAVAGLAVSLFVVPDNTPLWVWIVASMVVLTVLNVSLVLRKKSGEIPSLKARTVVIVAAVVFLALDVILSRLFR
jgi:hypothetical protein